MCIYIYIHTHIHIGGLTGWKTERKGKCNMKCKTNKNQNVGCGVNLPVVSGHEGIL